MPPLVSIIIPSFNQGDFLRDAIESVLSQDYKPIELFVFDGGSTDRSPEIIRNYASRLAGWAIESDRGQSDAINKGFRRAGGKYINRLCSDDIFLPGAINTMVDFLETHPCVDVVFGNARMINSRGETIALRKEIPYDQLVTLYALNHSLQPSALFKRSLLEKHGYVREDLRYSMDHELWLRFHKNGCKFGYINQLLSGYRYHPASKGTAVSEAVYSRVKRDFKREYGLRFSNRLIESAAYAVLNAIFRLKRKLIKLVLHGEFSIILFSWYVQFLNRKGRL